MGLCLGWAAAARSEQPLRQGASKRPPEQAVSMPTGAQTFSLGRPPPTAEPPACSFDRPVCVHRGSNVAAGVALDALAALERAFERLVLALGLPAPVSDAGAGSTDAFDLYLRNDAPHAIATGLDTGNAGPFDLASAFCIARPSRGKSLERITSVCLAEAVAAGLDAGLTPHLRRAYATALWWMTGEPTSRDLEAIHEVVTHPQRSIGARELGTNSEGAAILFEYLERQRGRAASGNLSTALLAAAASSTLPGSFEYHNEPDVFDVLRSSERLAEHAVFWGNFAVARGFIGDRDDGQHFPALLWAGSFGEARFDWVIPTSTLPRRVVTARPVEPLGALYVWVKLDQWKSEAVLGFQAKWEPPVAFKWQLVQLDELGREIHRFHVPFQERATALEQRLVTRPEARHIVISGTNMGGIGPAHPFDPDEYPYEPHAATVYLARL